MPPPLPLDRVAVLCAVRAGRVDEDEALQSAHAGVTEVGVDVFLAATLLLVFDFGSCLFLQHVEPLVEGFIVTLVVNVLGVRHELANAIGVAASLQ